MCEHACTHTHTHTHTTPHTHTHTLTHSHTHTTHTHTPHHTHHCVTAQADLRGGKEGLEGRFKSCYGRRVLERVELTVPE